MIASTDGVSATESATAAGTQLVPTLIQGGMGVAVSGWRLARAVSLSGQLGVISGTAIAVVLARRLQDGDPGGHLRRALRRFPNRAVAERILERYFRGEPRRPGTPYRAVPVPRWRPNRLFTELTVAASFVEVLLAKEGHDGSVGINLLEKIQMPTLAALYGAMLAGVDWVLVGAGIPVHIPAVLEDLAHHRPTSLPLTVSGAQPSDDFHMHFDPRSIINERPAPLERPRFLAIISSHVLASHLARSEEGRPWGFVVEDPVAGGHNAPPRGRLTLSESGEPVYGPRDAVDLEVLRELGLPFWLAGGYGSPARLREARAQGARGVQVGSAFALCEESGLDTELKDAARREILAARMRIRTDPLASPTGYPFKVAQLAGTAGDPAAVALRRRRCDLGYLTSPYRREDGTLGYRCAAEPAEDYIAKGGDASSVDGRMCLCNGLLAAAGMPQARPGLGTEVPILTLGDEVGEALGAIAPDGRRYQARDVVDYIMSGALG
jgi:NAD(P)H-dependent flavin oxidoreductase YrpB (nitropropane dioxygenase family)